MATIWQEFGTAVVSARLAKSPTLAEVAAGVLGTAGRMGYVLQIEQGCAVLQPGTVLGLARMLDLPDSVTAPCLALICPLWIW